MNDFDSLIPELIILITEQLDPLNDYKNLVLINKHYSQTISNIKLYQEFKEFWIRKDKLYTDVISNDINKNFYKCSKIFI